MTRIPASRYTTADQRPPDRTAAARPAITPAGLFGGIRSHAKPMNALSLTISWTIAVISVLQGAGIAAGGPGRWVGPGYTIVRMMPGAPDSWAVALMLFAAIALVGLLRHSFWLKGVGMFGIASWCAAFAGAGLWTVLTVPTAGTTSPFSYLLLAIVTSLMIFTDERPPNATPR